MLDRLSFVVSEAFTALWRSRTIALLAIITSGVALYVICGLGLIYSGLNNYGQSLTGKFELRVHFKDAVTEAQVSKVANEIREVSGVEKVNWIPRAKAWSKFIDDNPVYKGLSNPFPESLKVTLNDLGKGDAIAATIRVKPEVDGDNGVNYMSAEQRWVDQALHLLRWIGTVAGGLLIVIAGFQIFSVVRLTAMSRKVEMRIMQLVGSSHATTYGPFVLEGAVQGVLGGLVAWILLRVTYVKLQDVVGGFDSMATMPEFPSLLILQWASIAGVSYGVICSLLALIRLHQRVQ